MSPSVEGRPGLGVDVAEVLTLGPEGLDSTHRTVPGHDNCGVQLDHRVDGGEELVVGTDPAHRRAVVEQHVTSEQHALAGHVHDHVADLVGRAHVDQMRLRAVEVQHVAVVEQGGGQHRVEPSKS